MKNIILSSGGARRVYSVPDRIADHLEGACWYFRSFWIFESPQCEKFVQNGVACYNDRDFIDYLNQWEAPEFASVLIETLADTDDRPLPEKYKDCAHYHF